MASYAILVDFQLKPGSREAFRKLVDANARASVADEVGCRRFDVLEPAGATDRVVLYEIYDNRGAFEAHMRTGHFLSFDRESSDLVAAKSVVEFALVVEGSE